MAAQHLLFESIECLAVPSPNTASWLLFHKLARGPAADVLRHASVDRASISTAARRGPVHLRGPRIGWRRKSSRGNIATFRRQFHDSAHRTGLPKRALPPARDAPLAKVTRKNAGPAPAVNRLFDSFDRAGLSFRLLRPQPDYLAFALTSPVNWRHLIVAFQRYLCYGKLNDVSCDLHSSEPRNPRQNIRVGYSASGRLYRLTRMVAGGRMRLQQVREVVLSEYWRFALVLAR